MKNLVPFLDQLRTKLGRLRKRGLKETPTRTIVIDSILEALGWDVRDPDEVELEYPTIDGKAVDYALKINAKPVLLVEAKALDDPLSDVKAITQIVGYAANDGIVWCVLTNGVIWRVYRSVEKCPAPEKLMFEVSIDPRDSPEMSTDQIAAQLWRLSRGEMARGVLDEIGEQTFTDTKVRKALDILMSDPPRQLLSIIKKLVPDDSLSPRGVKASLARIWSNTDATDASLSSAVTDRIHRTKSNRAAARMKGSASGGSAQKVSQYDERHHIGGQPQEVVELYRALDRICMSLVPAQIVRQFKAKYISYSLDKHIFCCIHLNRGGLRVWLKLKYNNLKDPPRFARDVSGIGHWGVGEVELAITDRANLEAASPLVRASLEEVNR